MRTVIDYADFESTEMVITLGQSGNRFSPHYDDQLQYWLKGESIPFYRGDTEPDAAKSNRLVLRPATRRAAP
jgi:penicillin amidase